MNQTCRCGCGKTVGNWTQHCYPQPWWDTPGLPDRSMKERCGNHRNCCAYRDDDPAYCPDCHAPLKKCGCQAVA